MAHVAGAKFAIFGCQRHVLREGGQQHLLHAGVQLGQTGAGVDGHVVDLVDGCRVGAGGGQDIGLHGIVHKAEIAAGGAVAMDVHGLAVQHGGDPAGNDGRVGAQRVLPGAEDIEIAQPHRLHGVAARVHLRVQFIDIFTQGIRRQGRADVLFHFRQGRMVAIGGARRGIHEALHARLARGGQHVQETADIDGMAQQRVFQRTRDGTERRLVQHKIDGDGAAWIGTAVLAQSAAAICRTVATAGGQSWRAARARARLRVADIAFDEGEAPPCRFAHAGAHLLQVMPVARHKVVQAAHFLAQLQQGFQQVRADEAGHARHQPAARFAGQLRTRLRVGAGSRARHATD